MQIFPCQTKVYFQLMLLVLRPMKNDTTRYAALGGGDDDGVAAAIIYACRTKRIL